MNVPFNLRGQVENIPGGAWISQTFNAMIAAITAVWDVQHDDDGSHTTITLGSKAGPSIAAVTGSPEGVVVAPVGSVRVRKDGSTSTTVYAKTSGTAATGWTALGSGAGSGTVTNTGTLTSGKTIVGNSGVDVTVSGLTASVVNSAAGVQGAAVAGTDYVSPGGVTTSGLTQATARLLGRTTASTGAVEEITVGSGLSLSAGALTATGGSSGLVLLEQHTASSSASLDFTTCITSTYDDYQIDFINVIPATDGVDALFRVSTDGGASYVSSNSYRQNGVVAGGGVSIDASNPTSQIGLSYGPADMDSGSNFGLNGSVKLFNPLSTTAYKGLLGHVHYMTNEATPAFAQYWPNGLYLSTTAVNAFRVLFSSGNIASGTIRVYGLAK